MGPIGPVSQTTMATATATTTTMILGLLLWLGLAGLAHSSGDRFHVETHAIRVSEPRDLQGDYEAAMGDFGVPLYGGTLTGRVHAPRSNRRGCEKFGGRDFEGSEWTSRTTPTIALIDRGDCFFVQKAYHAQQAGADAVLIADNEIEPLVTMTTPQDDPEAQGLIKEIAVPTALISKKLADRIKRVLEAGDEVVMELSWEESMAHPDERVEWEFWTTSNDACGASCEEQLAFKEGMAELAAELETMGFTEFTPHYKMRSCEKASLYDKGDCESRCLNGGRYCPVEHIPFPYNETYSDREVALENLRQMCVFDYLRRTGQRQQWWSYVKEHGRKCRITEGTFGEACSRGVQRGLGLRDAPDFMRDVEECMSGSLSSDEVHPLLEREREHEERMFREGHGRITFLPTVIINQIQYRGRLEKASVLRGICAGFKEATEPGVCLQDAMQVNECASGHGCWVNPDASLGGEHSATCLDTFRGHMCMCPRGYLGDGYDCEEMNECSLGIADCDQKCVNTPGSYTCECSEGFEKIGRSQCILKDGCALNNGGCEQNCRFSVGGPQCTCDPGFELRQDGKTCADIDECGAGNHACEHKCINVNPSHSGGLFYVCACSDGYSLDLSDPLLRRCIKTEEVFEALGDVGHSPTYSVLEIVLIVSISVLLVFALGAVYYKCFHKKRMDREIRSILEQYVPLDDKPEAGRGTKSAGAPGGSQISTAVPSPPAVS
ncbi:vacuolar-sorting receptor [Chloropicon primus]|uniref:EGF-like domain-containing protein n=1 Tax=Chloropicon primus TaxID=1764295 RepID=A0A5B8MFV0_9CHLO|nr:hypothetical protein A3770_02p18440 [Chloropicon primus]UPQ98535.1 vacuolar-sorting receptor [Chloropicon primus]|eukprot:QDZ19326.1 hypothetical protein A3770_02p18440 [Chloropicon primus]